MKGRCWKLSNYCVTIKALWSYNLKDSCDLDPQDSKIHGYLPLLVNYLCIRYENYVENYVENYTRYLVTMGGGAEMIRQTDRSVISAFSMWNPNRFLSWSTLPVWNLEMLQWKLLELSCHDGYTSETNFIPENY